MRIALLTVLLAALVVPVAGARTTDTTISLVAYSTPKAAFSTIIPAFQKTSAGQGVNLTQSYGPSSDQAHAIVNGLPADVVDLSLEPDMRTLVKAGVVAPSWNANKYKGIVTRSVVVIVVRSGKKIRGWNDLIKPGVEVLTPNPLTSGGARWNVLAAYGAQLKLGKTPKQAEQYLYKLFRHVVVQDKSARDALNTFLGGKGDALLTYENEALLAQRSGQTRLFQHPEGDDPDRQPTRHHDEEPCCRKGVCELPLHADGAAPLRGERLQARPAERHEGVQLPGSSAALHHRLPRRLDEGAEEVLRPQQRSDGEDPGEPWRLTLRRCARPHGRAHRGSAGRSAAASSPATSA